jgi:MFS family permease
VIITLYALHLNVTPFELGLIIALYSLFPIFLAVYSGRVSDRFGFRLPLFLGSLAFGLTMIMPIMFHSSSFILYISQSLAGISQVLVLITMQNWIGSISTKDTRANHFSVFSLGVSLANMISPILTGYSIQYLGFPSTFVFLSVLASAAGLAFMLFPAQFFPNVVQHIERNDKGSIKDVLKSRPLRNIIIMSGVILTGIGFYDFYFPVYGVSIGLTASVIGVILGVNASAFFIVRLLIPIFTKKYQDQTILMYSMFVSAGSMCLIPLQGNVYTLAMASFILGLGLGCGQPLSIAMAYSQSPNGRTGEVLGLRLTANKVAQFSVPVLFGSVGSAFGFLTIFWITGMLLFTAGLTTSGFLDRRRERY